MSEQILYEDYKEQIIEAINKKLAERNIVDKDGFTLVDGFVNLPLHQELGEMVLGGPTIPAIAIVGNDSGLVYTFALKKLLPNIKF
ncbi:MAG: hypothetical protein N4A32_02395 [Marinifilaceae bacterium]|jgi:hypothetical protein|nr:hypothetical protein [Marinifilaceae bacterium]